MKERPILFSAPTVHAILAGTKTQTRRAVKGLSKRFPLVNLATVAPARFSGKFDDPDSWGWAYAEDGAHAPLSSWLSWCPYGQPGDRLWVRETFARIPVKEADGGQGEKMGFAYRADGDSAFDEMPDEWDFMGKWKPSIHMPRAASRITLEVVAVRVERLQDISEADAMAEGAPPSHPSIDKISREFGYEDFPRSWYGQLWEQINGPGSWDANPWVWVVEFKRVLPGTTQERTP